MSYDAFAESLRLLDGAPPTREARLSRRVRFVPLAVDRDGDVAATLFLRRGISGRPMLDVHSLEFVGNGWRMLGGGGGGEDRAVEPRPALAELQTPAVRYGGGGTARTARTLIDWRGRNWISWVELRAAREVAVLRVGSREVPVGNHGLAVVVWAGRPPTVEALDASGALLGPVEPARPPRPGHGMPAWYPDTLP